MSLLLGLTVVACAPKAPATDENGDIAPIEKSVKTLTPSKAEIDTVSYLVGINFGSFLKNYGFGEINQAQMLKGIKDFVNSKGDMRSEEFGEQFKINPNEMNRIFNAYLEKMRELKSIEAEQAEAKFFAANGKKAGVQTTESGLQYKIISEGNTEVKAGPVDTVWVLYKGTLLDGTVFDQTAEGAEPVKLTLNRVIKGWTEGLQLIGEGGEIELYIPSELGYGAQGTQGIEPNSTLIFNVKLSKVGKYAPEEVIAE